MGLLVSPFFISLLVMLGMFILLRSVFSHGKQQADTAASKRMKDLLESDALGEMPEEQVKVKQDRSIVNFLTRRLETSKTLQEPDGKNFMLWLKIQLTQAGLDNKYTPEHALAIALSIWTFGIGLPLLSLFILPGAPIVLLLLAIVFFALYPILKLRQLVSSRKDSIEADIPFFINDLYMSLSTGMTTIDQAIIRVARTAEEDPYESVLAQEFARAQTEYSMGNKSLQQSLRDVGTRTGVISVENLCEALIQGDRTGTELTVVLRDYSKQAQEMWRQAMRNYKNKATPKITLGMVVTMFGGVIIFATPFIIGIIETFSNI
jgi:pilus assembly protein TadC